jgi:hypothetical protein
MPKKSEKVEEADVETAVPVEKEKKMKKKQKDTTEPGGEKKSKKRALSDAEESSEQAPVICEPVTSEPSKVKKPLPPGYICKACGNGGHAIYDCPSKVAREKPADSDAPLTAKPAKAASTKKGEKSATPESANDNKPDANINKTYVSGLPFDMTNEKMKGYFEEHDCKVKFVNMAVFEDNKSKCKGFGFVTFEDAESTDRAISLTGANMGKKTLAVAQCVDREKEKPTRKKAEKEGEMPAIKKARVPKCYRCGENHDPATCSNPRICYRCRSSDHISSQCPKKKPSTA